ncbi:MAG: transglutaminaseTgpA domain-containing protein, partial [Planctomycetota bacterium]
MRPSEIVSPWAVAASVASVASYAIADADPVAGLGCVGVLLSYWMTGGRSFRPISRALVNALLAGIVSLGLLQAWDNGIDVELFSNFLVLLLIAKVLDRGRVRDVAQIVFLTLFLGIGSILTSNTLPAAIGLVTTGMLLLGSVFRIQIAAAHERVVGEDGALAEDAEVSRRRARRSLRAIGVGTAMFCLGLSGVVFVVMPREIGVSAFGNWGNASIGRQVSFADEVTLGTGGLISVSPDPVLDVRATTSRGESAGSDAQRFYLRGAVLTRYERGSWRRPDDGVDERARRRVRRSFDNIREHTISNSVAPRNWQLELAITVRNAPRRDTPIFTVWDPVYYAAERSTRITEVGRTKMLLSGGVSGRYVYSVRSVTEERSAAGARVPRPGDAGEAFDPAIGRVARAVLEDAGVELDELGRVTADARRTATLLEREFTRGDYTYTLDTVAAPSGRDPIAWFLTDAQRGHCEYYASAMAAM